VKVLTFLKRKENELQQKVINTVNICYLLFEVLWIFLFFLNNLKCVFHILRIHYFYKQYGV
jgi:hypothetical protein